MRFTALAAAGVAGVLLAAGDVLAQFPRTPTATRGMQGSRPALPSALGLLTGRNTAVNYFSNVVPLQQQRAFNTQVQSNLNQLRRDIDTEPEPDLSLPARTRGTGHPTAVMNYGGYFPQPSFQPRRLRR